MGPRFHPATVLFLLVNVNGQAEPSPAINLPEGFQARLFSGSELADDIFSMMLDGHGRVVVSSGGYTRMLYDIDGEQRADKATPYAKLLLGHRRIGPGPQGCDEPLFYRGSFSCNIVP